MLMNKKVILILLTGLLMIFVFVCVVAAAPEYVIRMHHGLPVGHYLDISHHLWADKVWEKSNGRVEIKIFPAAQLYNDNTAVQAVITGAIECAWDYDHKFFTVVPAIGGMGMPNCAISAVGDDNAKAVEAMQDSFYEGRGPGKLLSEKFEEVGLKIIHFVYWSEQLGVASKGKPIIKPAELKGKKIRVTTSGEAKLYRSVGAEAVALTGAELYEGLARGTIDCLPCPITHLEERKLKETLDYDAHPAIPNACIAVVVINMNYWNSLPKDIQQILLEAGHETDLERRGILIELGDQYRKKIEEEGSVKFINLTSEQQRVWIDFALPFRIETTKDLGPDAIEMWNACQDLKKEIGIKPYPYIE